MPSIRYMNQSAPFWDFIANMEEQGSQHPFFSANRGEGPQGWGWGPQHWHRGPPHPHHHDAGEGPSNQAPPPPPPEGEQPSPPQGGPNVDAQPESGHEGPSFPHRPHPHHRRGGCHGRRGRGGAGPWGRHGFGGFPLGGLEAFLNNQIFGGGEGEDTTGNTRDGAANQNQEDFKPDADIFDTETSFVVHVSLPGAKKEDVGVNWDAEKSELSVAGVIYRLGDEDFLKTLALDERKVGPFEKKIRLGSRANPAQVDADMITAKLEDGVLRVEVPKLDKDYVEIKKVDIE